jgi:adenylosuccinate synthase
MSVTMVIDLQFGSTGKGKVAYHEAKQYAQPFFVRTGGPNSGHTIHRGEKEFIFRQLGAGAVLSDSLNFLSAGCVIDEERLLWEIEQCGLPKDRLIIDPRAILLEQADRDNEAGRVAKMGTTASGNGEAMIRRMRREGTARFAGDSARLREVAEIRSVAPILHEGIKHGEDIVVEGVQGFALSVFHSPCYPFCTARDTTASAFASEVGLAPKHIDRVVGVMRAFVIRVGGNSGPLRDEIDWETIQRESGAPDVKPELTSVTKRLRRVGRFDWDLAKMACDYNAPDALAIMGVDRLDYLNTGKRSNEVVGLGDPALTDKTWDFLNRVEEVTGCWVDWVGTGFHSDDILRVG